MIPDQNLSDHGLLIVTGSRLRAEQADRPLAYWLKSAIESRFRHQEMDPEVVVLNDLWYLAADALHAIPVISIGGPGVNALSAYLYRKLPKVMVVDNQLLIQMDLHVADLRAAVWGVNHGKTAQALELFQSRGYLEQFLSAAAARSY